MESFGSDEQKRLSGDANSMLRSGCVKYGNGNTKSDSQEVLISPSVTKCAMEFLVETSTVALLDNGVDIPACAFHWLNATR